jgi:hypothetical protein
LTLCSVNLLGQRQNAVVVLGGEDHPRDPAALAARDPLPAVELGSGLNSFSSSLPSPPLAVGERVHPEVDEGRDLVPLPRDLPRRRTDVDRFRDDGFDRIVGG